jgi:hypothetical protein
VVGGWMDDERTGPKREYMSVLADSMPGKRVLSSRATRKGTRRERRGGASEDDESGYAERCREANAYATLSRARKKINK